MSSLRQAGLRPTRQRVALCTLLFGRGERHVTAEMLHGEVQDAGTRVALATVYNTLHQLRAAGLIRQIAVDGGRTFFDTNTTDHAHFFHADTGALSDAALSALDLEPLITVPEGTEVAGVDVIVRLRPKR